MKMVEYINIFLDLGKVYDSYMATCSLSQAIDLPILVFHRGDTQEHKIFLKYTVSVFVIFAKIITMI